MQINDFDEPVAGGLQLAASKASSACPVPQRQAWLLIVRQRQSGFISHPSPGGDLASTLRENIQARAEERTTTATDRSMEKWSTSVVDKRSSSAVRGSLDANANFCQSEPFSTLQSINGKLGVLRVEKMPSCYSILRTGSRIAVNRREVLGSVRARKA
ncbi:hypothetical protein TOPH_01539 [Tolypocladium ophioglossoides CBS 100239]|uniref:Uncharacterized protein n=1 Tax=Tolypocladium ophioglossoides (strain CBS 100239) TaxID=1163406 RepID=A0A0L0NHI6_TOLOC|nr:hypothetical protein TOPH_01539 [Tolypocladium ophioglossoides CBS 100239]